MRNVQYVVRKGDTLWDLSARFLGDPFEWHRLYTYNNRTAVTRITGRGIADPDLIYVGQKLLIPILSGKGTPNREFQPYRRPAPPQNLKDLLPRTIVPFAIKYRLEDLPLIVSKEPGFKATIKMSGSVVIKLADMVPIATLTNKGVEASLKAKTDQALGQLLSDTYVGLDAANKITYRCMMVSSSTTSKMPSTAIGLSIASDKPVPVLRGELRFPKLTGQINRHTYAAMDVKVVIEIEPDPPKNKGPKEEFQPRARSISQETVQEGLKWTFITGVVLLLGYIASDFLTGGMACAKDPILVPIALGMMGVSIAAEKLPGQTPIQMD